MSVTTLAHESKMAAVWGWKMPIAVPWIQHVVLSLFREPIVVQGIYHEAMDHAFTVPWTQHGTKESVKVPGTYNNGTMDPLQCPDLSRYGFTAPLIHHDTPVSSRDHEPYYGTTNPSRNQWSMSRYRMDPTICHWSQYRYYGSITRFYAVDHWHDN
jgi:hypothetical protein